MQNKKSYLALFASYLIWGFQPLYWAVWPEGDSMFILAARIIFAVIFTVGILFFQGRLSELADVFKSGRTLKYLVPAAFLLLADWGVYIWAVKSGHVFDASLGYYMNPLVTMLFGAVFFGERCSGLQIAAIALVVLGVAFSAVGFGYFPWVAVILALVFAVYAAVKKRANVDAITGIAAETLIMLPLAVAFIALFRRGDDGLSALNFPILLFLAGSGVVTAMPMLLYSGAVRRLPLIIISFFQYLCPTLGLVSGFILGESMTADRLFSFGFIWAGLALFSFALVREEKRRRLAGAGGPPPEAEASELQL